MVLNSITGGVSTLMPTTTPKIENSVTESTLVRQIDNKDVENLMSTEQYVRQYFKDIPVMIEIARCESHFRQLDSDGDVHRGLVNPEDVGVMQINEHYHLDRATSENYDIYTISGNTAYARELYEDKGTAPWKSSKACWGKTDAAKLESSQLAINSK